MKPTIIKILLGIFLAIGLKAQNLLADKIYLIELNTNIDVPYDFYLTSAYDYKKYETDVTIFPMDYEVGITPIENFTECFEPDIKIITLQNTFLICSVTGEGLLYVNKEPYKAQPLFEPVKIKLDEATQDFIAELEDYLLDYKKTLHYQCNIDPFGEEITAVIDGTLEYHDLFSINDYIDPDVQEIIEEDINNFMDLNSGLTSEYINDLF